jgi:hypothetical protein
MKKPHGLCGFEGEEIEDSEARIEVWLYTLKSGEFARLDQADL